MNGGPERGEAQEKKEREHARDSGLIDDRIARDARAAHASGADAPGTADHDGVRLDDSRQQSVRDDWDGVPSTTDTHTPSGKVEFRGDLYSGDDRKRVMHPSEGVGYAFGKAETDVPMLRARLESLPSDLREAMNRGDDNVRVRITASASREGSPERNQTLSEERGRDMASAMKNLGVKSQIEVNAIGESRAAAAGAPDIDNPADRVATIEVEVTERVPPPSPDETPSPADVDLPNFEVPKTKQEVVAESIEKELKGVKPSLDLRKAIEGAIKMQWLAAASGYALASATIAKNNLESGFAHGVVVGADGRSAEQLKELFWRYEPSRYPNQSDGKVAQNLFNEGLQLGFKEARKLSPDQRERMSDEVRRQLGNDSWRGDESTWGTKEYKEFYGDAAGAVRRLYMTNPGSGN